MKKTLIFFISLTLLLPFISGCAALLAGSAGAGTVAYIRGELQANAEADLEKAVSASNKAITNLQFIKVSEQTDKLASKIICRNAQDKKITITLKKITDNSTEVSIRVGMFGDQTLSLTLLDEINKEL
ncbi:MAG: DUF3568 family protein [Candidatus Aureabacteria bacterium]|nr:DUF3568 family protein [Candidatus Auribacterota bacterium]